MTRGLQNVEFLGRVSDAGEAQLFKTADIFVSPATGRESFVIVAARGDGAGTPIVCSDIHGYKGVVQRGARPSWCRRAMPRPGRGHIGVAGTPEMRRRMGAAGLERAQQFSLGARQRPRSRTTTAS